MPNDDNDDFTVHERAHIAMLITKFGGAHPNVLSPASAKKAHVQGDLEVTRVGRDIKIRATNRRYATPTGQQMRSDVEQTWDADTSRRTTSPGATFIPG